MIIDPIDNKIREPRIGSSSLEQFIEKLQAFLTKIVSENFETHESIILAEGLCKELPLISGTAFDTVTLLILRCRGCTVLALMSDAHSTPFTAASSQMVKWELNSESCDISNWLQTETVVEGVKFTGKVSQKPDDSAVNSTCIAARES